MPKIGIEDDLLRSLLEHRDALVLAITAGMNSGEWEQVIAPFDALLVAIKRIEEGMQSGEHPGV